MGDPAAPPGVTWRVKCCSSEDPVHPAHNVLTDETYRTWQTAQPTDFAWVEVAASPPTAFNKVELVNAGSSLVEIYGLPEGTRRGDDVDVDDLEGYDIVMTSQQIMTAKDLAAQSNRGREMVCEAGRKLTPPAAQQRWQRLRVVCKQPFGSADQLTPIGLARLRFFPCPPGGTEAAAKPEARDGPPAKPPSVKVVPESPSTPLRDSPEGGKQPRAAVPREAVSREAVFDSREGTAGELGARQPASRGSTGAPAANGKGRSLPGWASPSKDKTGPARVGVSTAGMQGPQAGSQGERRTSSESQSQKAREEGGAARNGEAGSTAKEGGKEQDKAERKETKREARPGGGRTAQGGAKSSRFGGDGQPSLVDGQSEEREETRRAGGPGRGTGDGPGRGALDAAVGGHQKSGEGRDRRKTPSRGMGQEEEGGGGGGRGAPGAAEQEGRKETKKRPREKTGASRTKVPTEFSKLLAGVVFAISGIQNPERAALREQALEMGAQYRPDWGPGCTLLVCAFAGTPKFREVKRAGGTIVAKEWIPLCYRRRQLAPIEEYLMHAGLPWKRGANGEDSSSDEEEEDEEWTDEDEEEFGHKPKTRRKASSSGGRRAEAMAGLGTNGPYQTGTNVQQGVPAGKRWRVVDAELASWVQADVAASEAYLRAQEVQPPADELSSVAAQGVLACLDDAIGKVHAGETVASVLEDWPIVPRAVKEVAACEAGQRGKDTWTPKELESELLRLKALYLESLRVEDSHGQSAKQGESTKRTAGGESEGSDGVKAGGKGGASINKKTERGQAETGKSRGRDKAASASADRCLSGSDWDHTDRGRESSDVRTGFTGALKSEKGVAKASDANGGDSWPKGDARGHIHEPSQYDSDAETELLSDDEAGEMIDSRAKYGSTQEGGDEGYDTEELDNKAIAKAKTRILERMQAV